MSIAAEKSNLTLGYGVEDVTPPVGEFCSFRLAPTKRSLGTHDKLFANALYLSDGENELLMISVDTVILPNALVERLKTIVSETTALPDSQILIASTHTHNGAELAGEEPLVDNSAQIERLKLAVAKAAETALKEKFSARLGWGHAFIPGSAKNRFQNRIEGGDIDLVDDRIDFLKIEDENGTHKGVLWHFAAHPTTCMGAEYLVSADFYGIANQLIVEKLGGFSVFFNGACGNINLELRERTFEKALFHGNSFAEKIINALPLTKTVAEGALSSSQTVVEVPLTEKRKNMSLPDDRDEIMEYFSEIESRHIPATVAAYDEERPRFQKLRTSWWKHKLADEFGDKESERVLVQAHRVLDNLIVTIPGEIFIEFQLELQKTYPENRAMIFGYANGYFGYIPDAKSYETDAYETSPTFMQRAGRRAGEIMMRTGKTMLNELSR